VRQLCWLLATYTIISNVTSKNVRHIALGVMHGFRHVHDTPFTDGDKYLYMWITQEISFSSMSSNLVLWTSLILSL